MEITQKTKRLLRSKAHKLKPVVLIGNQGLTEGVLAEIDNALNVHELIKVRVNAQDRQQQSEMITAICDKTQAEKIQTVGHILVIYRKRSE